MVAKLFKFMLAFIVMMASVPALVLLAVLVVHADVDRVIAVHPAACRVSFALYGAFVAFMFFRLQDRFIVFRPAAGTAPAAQSELLRRLERAFAAPVEGKRIFDFAKERNRVAITWSSAIDYVQPASAGGRGMKRVVVLTLEEKRHDVFFLMKDKDWGWDLSRKGFDVSLNYASGIFAEAEAEYHPSIVLTEEGGVRVDLKKLSYSSNDLWMPIQTAVLAAGWTLRGGMVPHLFARLLFAAPLALLFYLMASFITWIAGQAPAGGHF